MTPGTRLKIALAVGLGSGIGGVLRVLLATALHDSLGIEFAGGIMAANIIGSFVIGLVAALTADGGAVATATASRQFLTGGLCGGFTTFSFFSLHTMNLLQAGEWREAALYSAATLLLSMAAVALGYLSARRLARARTSRNGSN